MKRIITILILLISFSAVSQATVDSVSIFVRGKEKPLITAKTKLDLYTALEAVNESKYKSNEYRTLFYYSDGNVKEIYFRRRKEFNSIGEKGRI